MCYHPPIWRILPASLYLPVKLGVRSPWFRYYNAPSGMVSVQRWRRSSTRTPSKDINNHRKQMTSAVYRVERSGHGVNGGHNASLCMMHDSGLLMLLILMLAYIRYRLMSPAARALDRAVTFAFDSRSMSPLIFVRTVQI